MKQKSIVNIPLEMLKLKFNKKKNIFLFNFIHYKLLIIIHKVFLSHETKI